MRNKMVGYVSSVSWCNISERNKKTGKKLGVYPWLRNPHPKCPLRGE